MMYAMKRSFQHIIHVIGMICEVRITLNQTFIHCKQSCIILWNVGWNVSRNVSRIP
jgi:hypothetical protein